MGPVLAVGIYMFLIIGGHLMSGSWEVGDLGPIGQPMSLEKCKEIGQGMASHNENELHKQFPDPYRPGIVLCINEKGVVVDRFEWR